MPSWTSLPSSMTSDPVGQADHVARSRARRGWSAAAARRASARARRETCALVTRVEGRERLVEQQHLRRAADGAREGDALALAAGDLDRPRPGERRDAEPLEQLVHPLGRARGGRAAAAAARRRRSSRPSGAGRARRPGRPCRRRGPPAAAPTRVSRVHEREARRRRCGRRRAAADRRWRAAPRSCRRPRARRAPASRGPARSGRRARSAAAGAAARRSSDVAP